MFYLTATFISFSYCLIRARSPVWDTVSADSLYFVVLLFRRALFLLDGAISEPVVLLSRFHRLLSPGVGLTWWRYIGTCSAWDFTVYSPWSCLVFLICLSRQYGARECLGVCRLLNLTNVEDSGCTSLRVHPGSRLASGPALALVLHLPVKYGSRTLGLEFRCRIVSREEGYCVSWVPLGVGRVWLVWQPRAWKH